MIRIGVLSDTHMRQPEDGFAQRAAQAFAGADMILHAGDLVSLAVLEALAGLAPEVHAVAGNMDDHVASQSLPSRKVIQAEGARIGLIHGWGAPVGLAGRVAKEFDRVAAIVFGHSHRPHNAVKNGVLLFNPGSVSRGIMGSGTAGILTVEGGRVSGEIVDF